MLITENFETYQDSFAIMHVKYTMDEIIKIKGEVKKKVLGIVLSAVDKITRRASF